MKEKAKEKKCASSKCWKILIKRHRAFITTGCMIITFLIIGLLFLGAGTVFMVITAKTNEKEIKYDQVCQEQIEQNENQSNSCIVYLNLTETLKGRVILLYHLSSFYQNHRRIFQSKNDKQIKGSHITYNFLTSCSPKISANNSKDPSMLYLPCGLAPLSFFNDTYHFTDSKINDKFSEKAISLKQERENLYKPISSEYKTGIRWLEEITPLGTTDEHFIVWMRTAAMPNFIKVFSICDNCQIDPGNYSVRIEMNYPLSMYNGGRSIILTSTTVLGSRSYFISITYMATGGVSLFCALICLVEYLVNYKRQFGNINEIFGNEVRETHTMAQKLTEVNFPRRKTAILAKKDRIDNTDHYSDASPKTKEVSVRRNSSEKLKETNSDISISSESADGASNDLEEID